MRKWILLAALAASVFSTVGVTANRAEAMTLGAPAGLMAAATDTSLVQDVACRRVWRCGPWGCGWRPVCWWGGPRWHRWGGWGWGHRHWRHW